MTREPLGTDNNGNDVYLRDIWPSHDEVQTVVGANVLPEMFTAQYAHAFDSNERWNQIDVNSGHLFQWVEQSTYIQEPPFMIDLPVEPEPIKPIEAASVLCLLGDSVTTDHISPAGAIAKDSPAGRYLIENGVDQRDFNSYGSRRGNDRVMHRGTFANIRLRNQLAAGTEGGWTRHLPSGETMAIYDAAQRYQQENVPLLVLAGTEYGTGSSRDWAAKGTQLLGVRAVIATSFERIHRSNLVGMGVLPLEFPKGQSWQSLGLTGEEKFDIAVDENVQPRGTVQVKAKSDDGRTIEFAAVVRIDTPVELEYYRNGGILQAVLRKLLKEE